MMNCIVCEEELLKEQERIMVGVDIPYVNVWFHRPCYRQIKDELNEFLQKNLEKWYNKYVEEDKNDRKTKKNREVSRKF